MCVCVFSTLKTDVDFSRVLWQTNLPATTKGLWESWEDSEEILFGACKSESLLSSSFVLTTATFSVSPLVMTHY